INDTLTIGVPNDIARDWLEGRYTDLIIDILFQLTGSTFSVKFVIPEKDQASEDDSVNPPKQQIINDTHDSPKTMLNPIHTFDSFVIGAGNRFAHAASLAVAEAPAKSYNPLFIYGGVGLGKTHLMHAIGHYIQEHNPEASVVYLSSEKFTNEF